MTKSRRSFLKTGAAATVGAGAAALAAPAVHGQSMIRWRLQTYAGPALAEHVIKPAVDAFNKAANGEMEIELFFADQLVPTGELFRAMQNGTIDAVQSDDDSIAAPTDVSVLWRFVIASATSSRKNSSNTSLRRAGRICCIESGK